MKKVVEGLLQLLFPEKCRVCSSLIPKRSFLCLPCDLKIKRISGSRCTRCGRPFESAALHHPCADCVRKAPAFDWHVSTAFYEEPLKGLLHRFKYADALDLAGLFASWLADSNIKADCLLPVPVSKKRLGERGYNQSALIAKALSKKTGIPLLVNGLVKARETAPQTQLPRDQRRKNLKGAFEWKKEGRIKDKKIILIDDVFSTGSTLAECARTLREFHPAEIGAMTVAFNPLTGQNPG